LVRGGEVTRRQRCGGWDRRIVYEGGKSIYTGSNDLGRTFVTGGGEAASEMHEP